MAARVAIIAIVTNSSMSVKPRLSAFDTRALILDDTNDLLDRSKPRLDLAPRIGTQRHQAALRGQCAQIDARCARRHRVAEVIGNEQQLEHAESASKS